MMICTECRKITVHCQDGDGAPFCMRHDSQALKEYQRQFETVEGLIRAAKDSVKDDPLWRAIRERN